MGWLQIVVGLGVFALIAFALGVVTVWGAGMAVDAERDLAGYGPEHVAVSCDSCGAEPTLQIVFRDGSVRLLCDSCWKGMEPSKRSEALTKFRL